VVVADGVNAGRSAVTDGSGNYSLAGLQSGTFNVSVSAGGYATGTFSVSLTASTSRNFSLAPTGPLTTITPGQHRVNTDIAPGRYFAFPPSDCYWERRSGLGGTPAEIIASDWLDYPAAQLIVDILSSDVAFTSTTACGTWFNTTPSGAQVNISPGTWLVGAQVSPGTYRAPNTTGACYWERVRNFEGQISSIIANDFVFGAGEVFVSISPGDVGFYTGGCGTWMPSQALTAAGDSWIGPANQQSEADSDRNRALNREQQGGIR